MVPSYLLQIFYLLIGVVFVLGLYVVGRNLKRTIQNREKLLPLHVWTIAVSYLIMTGTFLHPKANLEPYIFGLRFAALVMGVYALGTLVSYQNKRTKRNNRNN